jgi:hypothetical protein
MRGRQNTPLKNEHIFAYVMEKLREGWSPEQRDGRAIMEHPQEKTWYSLMSVFIRFMHQSTKSSA